jgi:hypothetical protein
MGAQQFAKLENLLMTLFTSSTTAFGLTASYVSGAKAIECISQLGLPILSECSFTYSLIAGLGALNAGFSVYLEGKSTREKRGGK